MSPNLDLYFTHLPSAHRLQLLSYRCRFESESANEPPSFRVTLLCVRDAFANLVKCFAHPQIHDRLESVHLLLVLPRMGRIMLDKALEFFFIIAPVSVAIKGEKRSKDHEYGWDFEIN